MPTTRSAPLRSRGTCIDVKVGIPREVKNHEYRVAITPAGVHELARNGHEEALTNADSRANLEAKINFG